MKGKYILARRGQQCKASDKSNWNASGLVEATRVDVLIGVLLRKYLRTEAMAASVELGKEIREEKEMAMDSVKSGPTRYM